jgi:dTDP-4-dehydrorhamnose 3,5-epimerase
MIVTEEKLSGVFTAQPESHCDERGLLRRHFCQREFGSHGIMTDVRQCNVSENRQIHTLRGFHYQLPPHGEDKILSCMRGSIFDVVLDMREDSSTYLKWQSFELTAESRLSLCVPSGCANAYLTLEPETWVFYYHSEFYTPNAEAAIRYDDPFFSFEWPAPPAVISDRDRTIPDFVGSESPHTAT